MFGQPRCREWTPLATQQLRLRSLIQIVGYNIHGGECCSQPGGLYYTLHATSLSSPFYTSEKLLSNHPKWREIDSELIHKMSSHSVVVRVWRHTRHEEQKHPTRNDQKNALAGQKIVQTDQNTIQVDQKPTPNDQKTDQGVQKKQSKRHQKPDVMVQAWGVNFSGLLHIGANLALDYTPKSFKSNTLVFQMMGGYFCSYESLRIEYDVKGVLKPYNISNIDTPTVAKEASPSRKIPIENRLYSRVHPESKSVSPSRNNWRKDNNLDAYVSKSHSPPTGGVFRQNFASVRSNKYEYSKSLGSERSRYDCNSLEHVYEHSPKSENDFEIREYSGSDESSDVQRSPGSASLLSRDVNGLDIEESETAENFDAKDLIIPRQRYYNMLFLKSEVRPSYTAEKLQKLHQLQYFIKKRSQAVQEIKEKIYLKSAVKSYENLSPQYSLVDNEDFSRSEKLSMSCREYSLMTGKNKSRNKEFGGIFAEGCCDDGIGRYSEGGVKVGVEGSNEVREGRGSSLPPDKGSVKGKGGRKGSVNVMDDGEPSDRRFTMQLNKLLDIKTQPSPSQRHRHACLTRAAELSRFKRRLLQDERDAALQRLRKMRQTHAKLFEENQDSATELMQRYHSLSRKTEQLKELKKSEAALRELCIRSAALLHARRWKLVQDIHLIYPIQENEEGKLCILGIHLPACRDTTDRLAQVSEAALAVALGRAAHATALAAGLLGAPLRHPLRLMGSRTKVLDQMKPRQTEIALFARNKDSMMFRYGLFLLNKNIAQLLWAAQRYYTADPRDTLANLRRLLTPPSASPGLDASRMFGSVSSVETSGYVVSHPSMATASTSAIVAGPSGTLATVHPRSLRSLVACGGTASRQFNRFKESVDGHSPITAMVLRKHRYSRSVGSYIEEQCLQSLETASSVRGSEPSLITHSPQTDANNTLDTENKSENATENNIQNMMSFSESDLTKVTDIVSPESCSSIKDYSPKHEDKVIFSLGDDSQSPEDSDNQEQSKIIENIDKCNDYEELSSFETGKSNDFDERKILENDVNNLINEFAVLCEGDVKNDDVSEDDGKRRLHFSDCVDSSPECQNSSICESPSCDSSDRQFLLSKSNREGSCTIDESAKILDCSAECTYSDACCNVDIEKLGYPPFCGKPCVKKCPHLDGEFPHLHTGYDRCENGEEIMRDVIVLPSAEAVMTASSHYTDSPDLLDLQGDIESGLEADILCDARAKCNDKQCFDDIAKRSCIEGLSCHVMEGKFDDSNTVEANIAYVEDGSGKSKIEDFSCKTDIKLQEKCALSHNSHYKSCCKDILTDSVRNHAISVDLNEDSSKICVEKLNFHLGEDESKPDSDGFKDELNSLAFSSLSDFVSTAGSSPSGCCDLFSECKPSESQEDMREVNVSNSCQVLDDGRGASVVLNQSLTSSGNLDSK